MDNTTITISQSQRIVDTYIYKHGYEKETLSELFLLFQEECGELARAARKNCKIRFHSDTHLADVNDEAADVYFLLLAICNKLGVDLTSSFQGKVNKNESRAIIN